MFSDNNELKILQILGKLKLPIVRGYVRDKIIPLLHKDDNLYYQNFFFRIVYRNIDVWIKEEVTSELLARELNSKLIWTPTNHPWKKAAILNYSNANCESEEQHNRWDIPSKINILIADEYICTDFEENEVLFYPPKKFSDCLDCFQRGTLCASFQTIQNILNLKLTMKTDYYALIKKEMSTGKKNNIGKPNEYAKLMEKIDRKNSFYHCATMYKTKKDKCVKILLFIED